MCLSYLIKEINEYREKKKLVFFIGAGVSKISEYPSWAELVLSMADEIGYDSYIIDKDGKPRLSSEEFLKIPQMYYNKKGKDEYLKKVKSQLDVKREPNDIHKLIMKLNPYHLLTTNYDDLLEQTANIFSVNYSVINDDSKVSDAQTQRYILKVHGDFEKDNFVLKEKDYLDYEENYKLIDNVMKTIIASNMVVFIGYQLNDYNIKLILNWVQNVQKDSFIEPVFIYTDPEPLDEVSIQYYEKRRLRIICANEICQNGSYYDRYKAVLDKIITYKDTPNDITAESAINYIYNKLLPLDEIMYLRAKDFVGLFDGYKVNKTNVISNNGNKECIFEKLFDAYRHKYNLLPETIEKINYIIKRINNSGIIGWSLENETYSDVTHLNINNEWFYGNYVEIKNHLTQYGDSIKDLYNKAYDLCMLGHINESYNLYINLLDKCKKQQKWIYYYLVQANLKFLNMAIEQIKRKSSGFVGVIYFGQELNLFSEELLKNVELVQPFSDLPARIQRYDFLKILSSNNYYSEDIAKLYVENYEIAKDITNNSVQIIGPASYDYSEITMIDAIKFTYDNKLIFSLFSEHKNFIKITMATYLKGKYARMSIDCDETNHIKERKFEIDFYDILLIIENYKLSEFVVLEKDVDLKMFEINESEIRNFEEYIMKMMSYYRENFSGRLNNDETIMYIMIKEKIDVMCYLGNYFIKNKEVIFKLVEFMLFALPLKGFDYNIRLICLDKIVINNNNVLDIEIIKIIEKFLFEKVKFCIEHSNRRLLENWKDTIKNYSEWINYYDNEYKSDILSDFCSVKEYSKENKELLSNLNLILKDEAIIK